MSGGYFKYRCKNFYTHNCSNWVWINNTVCAQCVAAGREEDAYGYTATYHYGGAIASSSSTPPSTGYNSKSATPPAQGNSGSAVQAPCNGKAGYAYGGSADGGVAGR